MDYETIRLLRFVRQEHPGRIPVIPSNAMHKEPRMPSEQSIETPTRETDEPSSRHPGLARFADEMRRNHPGISDEEIADLFKAWTR